jgi:hypothetical protein
VAEAPAGETLTRFAIDPTGPERMLALTKSADGVHGQMYRSDDGGESWRIESVAVQPVGAEIFFDPVFANTAYLFSGRRLQRGDGAGDWVRIESSMPMESAWISPGGKLFWSALVQPPPNPRYPNLFPPPGRQPPHWEIFKSTTQGRRSSFVAYASCPDLDSVVFAPSDPEVAYAISTTCAPLAKSVDGSANWTDVASHDLTNLLASLLRGQVAKIAVDPEDASGLFVTLLSKDEPSGLLLDSDNGGRTWNPIPVPATPAGPVAISPSGRFLYVGTGTGVYRLSLTRTRALAPRD